MSNMETAYEQPSVAKRVYRNYLQTAQKPRIWSLCNFSPLSVVNTVDIKDAAERASDTAQQYRYNLVNAIHSTVTLAGDDPELQEAAE